MSEVTVAIGAGSIGQAIARRISAGRKVLLADLHRGNAEAAAAVMSNAGFEVSTATVDVSQRESVHQLAETAARLGDVTAVIHAAGVSPSQASPATILAVDLHGTALVLEEFGNIIAPGGAAVVIASQSGHRLGALSADEDAALATTPAGELLSLPMLQPDRMTDSLHAYQLAKHGNALRVMAEAVRWGKRGARVNTISPGIIITPLANDELTGPRGEGYRRMIEMCPAGRAGTPDEVATLGAILLGPDGAFITGSDFLMDGGVTASYFYGELAPTADEQTVLVQASHSLVPIGWVQSALRVLDDAPNQREGAPRAWIRFDEQVADGAKDLRPGDEIVVLTWLHLSRRDELSTHPEDDMSQPLTGVFSTCSPNRPNPIGLHRARIVARDGLRIEVDALEAIDGTPVVDVKPAIDSPA